MVRQITSSRERYRRSKRKFEGPDRGHAKRREHSALALVREFLHLLRGQQAAMAFSLATLSVATLLALVPPRGTKIVVDYVLNDGPLPETVSDWAPREPWNLLVAICIGIVVISLTRLAIQMWGRWHATRVTRLVPLSVRRRVLAHAMRLPLHRIQELRSGGVASILRQDADSVGKLVFAMLYNPLRAVFLVPTIYCTHRTWISKIRPLYRHVRAQREKVDAMATESFGGIQVVRAFNRQRCETHRIMRGNRVMARHELNAWWWTRAIGIVWQVLHPLATAALLLYGGWRVLGGELTLGDLMMFIVYMLMLLIPLSVLAQSAADFQNSLGLRLLLLSSARLLGSRNVVVGVFTAVYRRVAHGSRISARKAWLRQYRGWAIRG